MCLRVTSKKKIAKYDITCYKLLRVCGTPKYPWFITPFQICRVILGETYFCKLGPVIESNITGKKGLYVGLHSFLSKKEAIKYCKICWYGDIVVKCIIPKGSEYYKGKFYSDHLHRDLKSAASSSLHYTNEIVFSYRSFLVKSPSTYSKIINIIKDLFHIK